MDPTNDLPSSPRAGDPSLATANRPSRLRSSDVHVRKANSKGVEQLERPGGAASLAARGPAVAKDGGPRIHTDPLLFILDKHQPQSKEVEGVELLDCFCVLPKAIGDALLEHEPLGPGSIVFLVTHSDAFFGELKKFQNLASGRPARVAPREKRKRGEGGSASSKGIGGTKRPRGGDNAGKDDRRAHEGFKKSAARRSDEEEREDGDANVEDKGGSDGGGVDVSDSEDGAIETEEEAKRADSPLQEGTPKPSELYYSGAAGLWVKLYGKRPVVTAVARVKRVSLNEKHCNQVSGVGSIRSGDDEKGAHYLVELEKGVVKVVLPWTQFAYDLGMLTKMLSPSFQQGRRRCSNQSLAEKYRPALRHYYDTATRLLEDAKQHGAMDRAMDFPPHGDGGGYQAFLKQYPRGMESRRQPRQKQTNQEKQPPGAQETAVGDAAGPSVPATAAAARVRGAATSPVNAAAEGAGGKRAARGRAAGRKLKVRKQDDGEGLEATPPTVKRPRLPRRRIVRTTSGNSSDSDNDAGCPDGTPGFISSDALRFELRKIYEAQRSAKAVARTQPLDVAPQPKPQAQPRAPERCGDQDQTRLMEATPPAQAQQQQVLRGQDQPRTQPGCDPQPTRQPQAQTHAQAQAQPAARTRPAAQLQAQVGPNAQLLAQPQTQEHTPPWPPSLSLVRRAAASARLSEQLSPRLRGQADPRVPPQRHPPPPQNRQQPQPVPQALHHPGPVPQSRPVPLRPPASRHEDGGRVLGDEIGGGHGRNRDDAPEAEDGPLGTVRGGGGGGGGNASGTAVPLGPEAATHRSQPAAQARVVPWPSSPMGVIPSHPGRPGPPNGDGGEGQLTLEDEAGRSDDGAEFMGLTAESEEEEEEDDDKAAAAPAAGYRPGCGDGTVSTLTGGALGAARQSTAEAAEPGQERVEDPAAAVALAAAEGAAVERFAPRETTARHGAVGSSRAHVAVVATGVVAAAIDTAINGHAPDAGTNATVAKRRGAMSICGGVPGGGGSCSEGGTVTSLTHSDGSADYGGGGGVSGGGVSGGGVSGGGVAACVGDDDDPHRDEAESGGEGVRSGDGVAGAAAALQRGSGVDDTGSDGGSGREQLEPAEGGGVVRRANVDAAAAVPAVPADGGGTSAGSANAAVPHSSASGGEAARAGELDGPEAMRKASGGVENLLNCLYHSDISEDVSPSDRTARRGRGTRGGSYCGIGGAGAAPPDGNTARHGAGGVGGEEEEDEEGTAAAAGEAADRASSFTSGDVGADSKWRDGLGQEPVQGPGPGPVPDPVSAPAPDLDRDANAEPSLSPPPRAFEATHLVEDMEAAGATTAMSPAPAPAPLAVSAADATAGATAEAASADGVIDDRGARGGGIHGDRQQGARSTPIIGGGGDDLNLTAEEPAVQGSGIMCSGVGGLGEGEGGNRCLPPLPLSVSPSYRLPRQPPQLALERLAKRQPSAQGRCGQTPEAQAAARLANGGDGGISDDDKGSCRLGRGGAPKGVCSGASDADAGPSASGRAAGDRRCAASDEKAYELSDKEVGMLFGPLKQFLNDKLKEQVREHSERQRKEYAAALTQQKEKYAAALTQHRAALKRQRAGRVMAVARERAVHAAARERQREEHAAELARQREKHAAELAQQQEEHAAKLAALRDRFQELHRQYVKQIERALEQG